ncbi:replication initiator protein [Capybara microvirus Cap3_SP_333]|nr:replication initiator protein [Capybara microvirus Cap3_SP_333]
MTIPNKGNKQGYTGPFIVVPCGQCDECRASRQREYAALISFEALTKVCFFVTLTYQDSALQFLKIPQLDGTVRGIHYPPLEDFQNFIKRLRKDNAFGQSFRFFACREYGSRTHRAHWHMLLMFDREDFIHNPLFHGYPIGRDYHYNSVNVPIVHQILNHYWVRNYGSTRKPLYQSLNDKRYSKTLDVQFCDGPVSKVAGYVAKYCTKYDEWSLRLRAAININCDEYDAKLYWKLVRPRCYHSVCLGQPFSWYSDEMKVFCLKFFKRFVLPIVVKRSAYSLTHPDSDEFPPSGYSFRWYPFAVPSLGIPDLHDSTTYFLITKRIFKILDRHLFFDDEFQHMIDCGSPRFFHDLIPGVYVESLSSHADESGSREQFWRHKFEISRSKHLE